ncbi:MAG: hypothetical protein K2P78_11060, partial [Gemmataceae bacterium]|nr:hypothetical protein [Gemmataceae bacterium]
RSGDRSAKAVDALADAGFTNVYSQIEGFEGDLSADGRRRVAATHVGPAATPLAVGQELAAMLLAEGAAELLGPA